MKVFLLLISSIILVNCGNAKSPTGGPKDIIQPEITNIFPEEFQDINNATIEIVFSKPIKRSTLLSGFKTYPSIDKKKISWDRSILKIAIKDSLKKDTNYYFTFSQEIKGEHNNTLDKEYIFTFRSGKLHQNTLQGKFIYSDEDDKNFSVSTTLSSIDSTVIFQKEFTKNEFSFDYLNPDSLIFRAFIDKNGNKKYDQQTEPFCRKFVSPQKITLIPIELVYVDTLKPKLKKISVLSNSLLDLEFSENINELTLPIISIVDSLIDKQIPIIVSEKNDNHLQLIVNELDTLKYSVKLPLFSDFADNVNSVEEYMFDGTTIQDTLSPKILRLEPENGQMVMNEKPELKVTFSEIILAKDFHASLISAETKKEIKLNHKKMNSKEYILVPQENLTNYNSYRFKILKSTSDFAGNEIEQEKENKFIIIKNEEKTK